MGNSELESATYWLSWVERGQLVAAFLVALGVAMEFIGSWIGSRLHRTIEDARTAEVARLNNDTERLRAEAAKASERAALTEETILAERRLTARERWRLERVERAVFPRVITQEQRRFLVSELKGKISSMNICALDRAEPRLYALSILQVLHDAGVSTKLFWLPKDSDEQGIVTYVVNEDGRVFAKTLWKVRIGGGTLGI